MCIRDRKKRPLYHPSSRRRARLGRRDHRRWRHPIPPGNIFHPSSKCSSKRFKLNRAAPPPSPPPPPCFCLRAFIFDRWSTFIIGHWSFLQAGAVAATAEREASRDADMKLAYVNSDFLIKTSVETDDPPLCRRHFAGRACASFPPEQRTLLFTLSCS